jgi:hypothetical protein
MEETIERAKQKLLYALSTWTWKGIV